jgi:Flp pilus assembly protein TadD
LSRGNAKSNINDYAGAIADYTKAIEIDPENIRAYDLRGITKMISGQKDSGSLDIKKALELRKS